MDQVAVSARRGGIQRTQAGSRRPARQEFEHPDGLRSLLDRLAERGDEAWRHDPEAASLMGYVARRYASLARKHGLDPWEAASAAFDAMRTNAVRRAVDPWAVVTRAVQVTMIAEERANGLLCSTHQARRPQYSSFHDVDRFCDREDRFPDFQQQLYVEGGDEIDVERSSEGRPTAVSAAIDDTIELLSVLGWDDKHAREVVLFICTRLAELGSRSAAYESLRRDRHAEALLDVPAVRWNRVLRIVLGSPDPDRGHYRAARGVLLRLMIGEPLRSLLSDLDLVLAVEASVPEPMRAVA